MTSDERAFWFTLGIIVLSGVIILFGLWVTR